MAEDQFICICNRPGEVRLMQWDEPHPGPDGKDFNGVKRAYICDDCVVVHWAYEVGPRCQFTTSAYLKSKGKNE